MEPKGKGSDSSSSEPEQLGMSGNHRQNEDVTLSHTGNRRNMVGNQSSSSQVAAQRAQNDGQHSQTQFSSSTSDEFVIVGERLEQQQPMMESVGSSWEQISTTQSMLENSSSGANALSVPAAVRVTERCPACANSDSASSLQENDGFEMICQQHLQQNENHEITTRCRRVIPDPDFDPDFRRILDSDSDDDIRMNIPSNLPPMTRAELLTTMQDLCSMEEYEQELRSLFPETIAERLLIASQVRDADTMEYILSTGLVPDDIQDEEITAAQVSLTKEQQAELQHEVDFAGSANPVATGLASENFQDESRTTMNESLTEEQQVDLQLEVDEVTGESFAQSDLVTENIHTAETAHEALSEEQQAALLFEVDVAASENSVATSLHPDEIRTGLQHFEDVAASRSLMPTGLASKIIHDGTLIFKLDRFPEKQAELQSEVDVAAGKNHVPISLPPEDLQEEISSVIQESSEEHSRLHFEDVFASESFVATGLASGDLHGETKMAEHENLSDEQQAELQFEIDVAVGENLVSPGLTLENMMDELKIAMEESLSEEQQAALQFGVEVAAEGNLVSPDLSPEDMQEELRNAMQESLSEEQQSELPFEVNVASGENFVSSGVAPQSKNLR